jgi:hypothetical protein
MEMRNQSIVLFICALSLAGASPSLGQDGKKKWLQVGLGTKPFDVTRHSIEIDRITLGGPPRDGIPALVDPEFVSAASARKFLRDRDEVLGVVWNGLAKAYPLKILNHHEVVNDRLGEKPIAVTY